MFVLIELLGDATINTFEPFTNMFALPVPFVVMFTFDSRGFKSWPKFPTALLLMRIFSSFDFTVSVPSLEITIVIAVPLHCASSKDIIFEVFPVNTPPKKTYAEPAKLAVIKRRRIVAIIVDIAFIINS